ncbi:MAG: putative peptidoglycan glycosyltransferase FtsW [Balneolaceae bacterium]|nr:putative peptidoglycan glycosyltransferase FtsW [Balneolaceae bacterium]
MYYTTPNSKVGSIFGTTKDELEAPDKSSDQVLLVTIIGLMIFGCLAVYSSIAFFAQSHETTAVKLVSGHAVKLAIAFFVMIFISKINYRVLARFSRAAMVLSWALLIVMHGWGDITWGAQRSLSIGNISFQPTSFAAMALIVHVAVLLYEKQEYIKDFKRTFLPILFWVGVTFLLIATEDFSNAAVLMGICILMMFVGRVSIPQLSALVLIGLIGGASLIYASSERQSRIEQYLAQITEINNQNFETSEGYQSQQAHIAIAQGQIFGVGIGKSTQRDFLPAPYNDFIFAIIAEEYGIVGACTVIFAYLLILYRGVAVIARQAPDVLGTLMALGCSLLVSLYAFVNAGVASGLLPVTGLPMPFVSYGGSSMIFAGAMTGILLNISRHVANIKTRFYNG